MVPVLIKQHNLLKSPRTPALKSRQPQQPSLQERAKFTTHCISVNPFSPAIGANAPSAGAGRCSIPSARAGWSGAEQAAGSSLPHFFTAKVQNCLCICFSLPGAAKTSRINKTDPEPKHSLNQSSRAVSWPYVGLAQPSGTHSRIRQTASSFQHQLPLTSQSTGNIPVKAAVNQLWWENWAREIAPWMLLRINL